MVTVDCFDCGKSVQKAVWEEGVLSGVLNPSDERKQWTERLIWQDAVLSGALKPVCVNCKDTVPEVVLWDVAEFEEDHFVYDMKLPDGAKNNDWV